MIRTTLKFAMLCSILYSIAGCAGASRDGRQVLLTSNEKPAPKSLRNGLIGYWKFENNCKDHSGSNYDLRIRPGVTFEAGMRGSRAVRIPRNDSQYVRGTRDFPQYDFGNGTFTIQVWVRFNTLSHEQVLLEKVDGPGWTLTKLPDQRLVFDAGPIGVTSNVVGAFSQPGWHQVVVRRREESPGRHVTELYVDSQFIAWRPPYNSGETIPDSPEPLLVGKRWKHDDKGFDGWVDEVAIWNRGLSEIERASLWGGGRGIDLP